MPVSENATRNGADLLLWFEPERVTPHTALHREHPEWIWPTSGDAKQFAHWSTRLFDDHPDWLIGASGPGQGFGQWSLMLNIGNQECRRLLTDHYCKLIQDNGVKIYRQDFNFPPLPYWRDNEPADRQGVNENLYVQGYLQLWDDIMARNPGLWIDSCASGGRRNDLETMRRSVPLHYSDYGYGDHPVKLAFQHTLCEWIPYFKEFTMSWDLHGHSRFDRQVDSFSFHCAMAAMLNLTLDIRRDDYDFALALRMTEIWRRASNLLLNGDYYPLTPFSKSPERWEVRQFDQPETGQGLIQGIRLPACAEEQITVVPKALDPEGEYVLENPETGESRQVIGSTLLSEGFTFALPRRSGAIWFYRR
jgi:alpha-galactosidase